MRKSSLGAITYLIVARGDGRVKGDDDDWGGGRLGAARITNSTVVLLVGRGRRTRRFGGDGGDGVAADEVDGPSARHTACRLALGAAAAFPCSCVCLLASSSSIIRRCRAVYCCAPLLPLPPPPPSTRRRPGSKARLRRSVAESRRATWSSRSKGKPERSITPEAGGVATAAAAAAIAVVVGVVGLISDPAAARAPRRRPPSYSFVGRPRPSKPAFCLCAARSIGKQMRRFETVFSTRSIDRSIGLPSNQALALYR